MLLYTSGTTGDAQVSCAAPPPLGQLHPQHRGVHGCRRGRGHDRERASVSRRGSVGDAVGGLLGAGASSSSRSSTPGTGSTRWNRRVSPTPCSCPTMLSRIVDELDARGGEPMLGLRAMSYGGGKMPTARDPSGPRAVPHHQLRPTPTASPRRARPSRCWGRTTIAWRNTARTPAEQQRLASAGRPLPGVEVAIRDDDGNDLAARGGGRDLRPGPRRCRASISRRARCSSTGGFPTRDGGYIDDGGYLFVQGRNDDVIIRGGENMSPGEIEDVLLMHEGVKEAAAIGVPDYRVGREGRGGDRRPRPTARHVRRALRSRPRAGCGRAGCRSTWCSSTSCRGTTPASCCAACCEMTTPIWATIRSTDDGRWCGGPGTEARAAVDRPRPRSQARRGPRCPPAWWWRSTPGDTGDDLSRPASTRPPRGGGRRTAPMPVAGGTSTTSDPEAGESKGSKRPRSGRGDHRAAPAGRGANRSDRRRGAPCRVAGLRHACKEWTGVCGVARGSGPEGTQRRRTAGQGGRPRRPPSRWCSPAAGCATCSTPACVTS